MWHSLSLGAFSSWEAFNYLFKLLIALIFQCSLVSWELITYNAWDEISHCLFTHLRMSEMKKVFTYRFGDTLKEAKNQSSFGLFEKSVGTSIEDLRAHYNIKEMSTWLEIGSFILMADLPENIQRNESLSYTQHLAWKGAYILLQHHPDSTCSFKVVSWLWEQFMEVFKTVLETLFLSWKSLDQILHFLRRQNSHYFNY